MLVAGTVTAGRSDAYEKTITLEEDEEDIEYLLTENGKKVEVWIDSIDSHNGSTPHPIDVYIASSDEYWDHFCGGEGNQFADDFSPVYVKEGLVVSDVPYHFEWTPDDDESYYLIFDNCDNQRTTDYKDDVTAIKITFAVDDQSDEVGDAIVGFLGGSLILMCLVPTCCGIVIVLLLIKLVFKKQPQTVVVAPGGMGGQVPMIGQQVPASPGMVGQAVSPAPIGQPNPAADYYAGLLNQGYDPATAQSYTTQHYPGFQP